ncbi:MAG TPA: multidrug ABC transporter ATP-binding protein, partial [Clostridiales bacterium]|nr:multidrug ABC transporter ATP-binding protein [Clostridiales bacterium]
GYFDQEQDSLNPGNTIMDELWDAFPQKTETQIRNTLALFLFQGDDVHKTICQASGGERGRVMLAKLMLAGKNLLLLDEPTNHLDIESREVLEETLAEFDGTLLFVSHDRYFIDRLADRIVVIEDRGTHVVNGDYTYYAEECRKSRQNTSRAEGKDTEDTNPEGGTE